MTSQLDATMTIAPKATGNGDGAATPAFSNATTINGSTTVKPVSAIPIRKVVKASFRGPPPKDQALTQLYMPLPDVKSPLYIDTTDAVMKTAFDKIRAACEVWIEVEKINIRGEVRADMLLVSGRSLQNVSHGLKEIRCYQRAQAKQFDTTASILIHRVNGVHSNVVLERPSALGARLPDGSWRGLALYGDMTQDDSDVPALSMAKRVFDAYKQSVMAVRPDLGQKYVRIHLGLRTMTKKKRSDPLGLRATLSNKNPSELFNLEARDKYTTAGYQSLLESAIKRGHSSFYVCFGGESLARTILQHIQANDDAADPEHKRFVPLDATMEFLRNVKPKFSLVFFSAGFRVEMDIHFESAATRTSATNRVLPSNKNVPTASNLRVFRFNKTVDAEVVVACPDMKVDWQISVESDLSTDKIHDKFRELATHLCFEPVEQETVTFPVFTVSRDALLRAHIDGVACKVYRTFECVSTPYLAEIATYYDWNDSPLAANLARNPAKTEYEFSISHSRNCPIPYKSCAVSLYGDEWDNKVKEMNPTSVTYTDDLIDLFYNEGLVRDYGSRFAGEMSAAQLLHEVEFLLDMTTQAATELESLDSLGDDLFYRTQAIQTQPGPSGSPEKAAEGASLLGLDIPVEAMEPVVPQNNASETASLMHFTEPESLMHFAETESLLD